MESEEEQGSSLDEQVTAVLRHVWDAASRSSQVPTLTLGVTSCTRGEGVTTVARLLAKASLRLPLRQVLLVEVEEDAPAIPAALFEQCARPTIVSRLERLVVGSAGGAATLRAGLDNVRPRFELVVVALPPAGRSTGARELASVMDRVLLVIEPQRLPLRMIQQVKDHLDEHGARLVGVILNKA